MTSQALKTYHETHNIPQVREYAVARLRSLADEVQSGAVDDGQLEYLLGQLSDISYKRFGAQFFDLHRWLRSLKAALRDEDADTLWSKHHIT